MTPEGKVKAKVSALLKTYKGLFYTMPVPSGYGESTLDYLGCYRGWFFAIETKAPAGGTPEPTARQKEIIRKMREAGASVFVTDGNLSAIQNWLDTVKATYEIGQ